MEAKRSCRAHVQHLADHDGAVGGDQLLQPRPLKGGGLGRCRHRSDQGQSEPRARQVFEDGGDVRALSQARRLPLVPDVFGETQPAGGMEGFSLPELIQAVRTLDGTDRGARREVNR